MLHHHHLSHVPHVPHLDLRAMGRDAVVAAEVALAAVVLTGSIEGHLLGRSVEPEQPAETAPPGGTVAAHVAAAAIVDLTPAVTLAAGVDGIVAHVRLPTGGSSRIDVVGADGVAVAAIEEGQLVVRIEHLAAGEYHLVVSHEGLVEHLADAAVSSAMVVRSRAMVVGAGEVVTVMQQSAG